MAGTLFGLGLSQRVTLNGLPDGGWLLYVYDSGTSTPAATYSDTGLTTELSFPIEADSYGMLPDFWVADGTYRARGTNSAGSSVFFDRDGILAIGPSSGTGTGGGGTVDPNAVLLVGDIFWRFEDATRTGAVRLNGLTIGSLSSGATERASSDTQTAFEYLWNHFGNGTCPVSGGRGASATADFTANKTITLLDFRGVSLFGLDTMGNSAAGILPGAIITDFAGDATRVILSANLPSANFNILSATAAAQTINITNGGVLTQGNDVSIQVGAGATHNGMRENLSTQTVSATASSSAVTGTVASGGSNTPLSIVPPCAIGTWYMKL